MLTTAPPHAAAEEALFDRAEAALRRMLAASERFAPATVGADAAIWHRRVGLPCRPVRASGIILPSQSS